MYPPPEYPPPLPMTPPLNPSHTRADEDGRGGWIGYIIGTFLIIIGIILLMVMIFLWTLMAGLGGPAPSIYQLVGGPATTIFSGVLLIVLWWKRDTVISWWERVFRGN